MCSVGTIPKIVGNYDTGIEVYRKLKSLRFLPDQLVNIITGYVPSIIPWQSIIHQCRINKQINKSRNINLFIKFDGMDILIINRPDVHTVDDQNNRIVKYINIINIRIPILFIPDKYKSGELVEHSGNFMDFIMDVQSHIDIEKWKKVPPSIIANINILCEKFAVCMRNYENGDHLSIIMIISKKLPDLSFNNGYDPYNPPDLWDYKLDINSINDDIFTEDDAKLLALYANALNYIDPFGNSCANLKLKLQYEISLDKIIHCNKMLFEEFDKFYSLHVNGEIDNVDEILKRVNKWDIVPYCYDMINLDHLYDPRGLIISIRAAASKFGMSSSMSYEIYNNMLHVFKYALESHIVIISKNRKFLHTLVTSLGITSYVEELLDEILRELNINWLITLK